MDKLVAKKKYSRCLKKKCIYKALKGLNCKGKPKTGTNRCAIHLKKYMTDKNVLSIRTKITECFIYKIRPGTTVYVIPDPY